MTSLNFYDSYGKTYNTFDDRTRLNEETGMFISRIRYEQSLIKSIDLGRTKSGIDRDNRQGNFKANVAKKSFFYKQFKNFLY